MTDDIPGTLLLNPAVLEDPYPFYERCRGDGDVVWDETAGAWLIVGYHAARQVLGGSGWTSDTLANLNARAAMDSIGPELVNRSMLFADGDKSEYPEYLAEALRLLKPGGVVAFDNALWHDRVADPAQRDEETVVIRDLGKEIAAHESLVPMLLPVGDGLLVAKKEWTGDEA